MSLFSSSTTAEEIVTLTLERLISLSDESNPLTFTKHKDNSVMISIGKAQFYAMNTVIMPMEFVDIYASLKSQKEISLAASKSGHVII